MKLKKFTVLKQAEGQRKPTEEVAQAINEQQLRSLYAQVGEKILEIREVTEGDDIKTNGNGNANRPQSVQDKPNIENHPESQHEAKEVPAPQEMTSFKRRPDYVYHVPPAVKSAPKFYSVGGVEIKEQDGKIYQKQWLRLDDNEASNYRIVSDSSNKLVSLNGKHIEMKKWVLLETVGDNDHEESDRELVNG